MQSTTHVARERRRGKFSSSRLPLLALLSLAQSGDGAAGLGVPSPAEGWPRPGFAHSRMVTTQELLAAAARCLSISTGCSETSHSTSSGTALRQVTYLLFVPREIGVGCGRETVEVYFPWKTMKARCKIKTTLCCANPRLTAALLSGYIRTCIFICCAEFQAAPRHIQRAQHASELENPPQFSSICVCSRWQIVDLHIRSDWHREH